MLLALNEDISKNLKCRRKKHLSVNFRDYNIIIYSLHLNALKRMDCTSGFIKKSKANLDYFYMAVFLLIF